ncbi:citrate lyase subunit beta [Ascodesmis nigricans]|uniref:Citrate lyase subunit beta n=1 Tax=Ascodesmis nigricans TaxID=341454 RepID=A0A4S2N629_9PEZI|nr:citrate lyase subunit beta [Ascodesmis nigricans]
MATTTILRRALLYVPSSSPKMLNKAQGIKVDCLTYDLEDSVTPTEKPNARKYLGEVLKGPKPPGVKELAVRINADTKDEDIAAIAHAKHNIDALVIPKVNSSSDLQHVTQLLTHHQFPPQTRLIALIESALGVLSLDKICTTTPLLTGLIFAAEDFALDLSLTRTPSLTEFLFARQSIVTAACAYNLAGGAMDLVCTDYRDTAALERECENGVQMGFRGKQCIHPSQVEVVERMFLPSSERVRWAVRILTADRRARELGKGSWGLGGKMVDRPVVEAARAVVGKMELAGVDLERVWEEEKGTVPE